MFSSKVGLSAPKKRKGNENKKIENKRIKEKKIEKIK